MATSSDATARNLSRDAGFVDLGQLIAATARQRGAAIALDDGHRTLSYAAFDARANRAAQAVLAAGLRPGERIAVLAENRMEYLELAVAAARTGVILCALNWRFSAADLHHCIALTTPRMVFVSARHAALLATTPDIATLEFGDAYEALLAPHSEQEPPAVVAAEDGYILLFTSGTTGASKAALISHRAELARFALSRIDTALAPGDNLVAWAPLFHMVALEHALHVLALGGTVHLVDGADATSRLFQAPYWNTFGSTETGMLPFAATRLAVGEQPTSLAKAANSMHLFKLVDDEDGEVAPGQPGEVAVRGPTLFSGYWQATFTWRPISGAGGWASGCSRR